jgi:hypothetical protein
MTGDEPGRPGPAGAAALRQELAGVDARLAGIRAESAAAVRYGPLALACVTGAVALLLALVAVVSVIGAAEDGDLGTGLFAAALLGAAAAGLTVATVRLQRRAFSPVRAVAAERWALLARRQQLIAALAGAAPDPAAAVGPAGRQPGAWATAMHAKFPLGPAPADALRRLPPDAPAWRAWLAGTIGWGAVAAVLLLLGLVVVGTAVAVLLTAGG